MASVNAITRHTSTRAVVAKGLPNVVGMAVTVRGEAALSGINKPGKNMVGRLVTISCVLNETTNLLHESPRLVVCKKKNRWIIVRF